MENIGSLAILLAFCFAVYSVIGSLAGKWGRRPFLVLSAERAVYCIWALLSTAAGILIYSLISGDYRMTYVWAHSNHAMPTIYKFSGFWGKFYVFNAALASNLIWLAILLALNSVIGSYYYLRVMVAMYMREPKVEIAIEPVPWTLSTVLWIAAVGTVYVGLFPTRIIGFAVKAAMNIR